MNSKALHNMTREPTLTSSPTEIRLWVEDLDYSFLIYGENFERAGINGEKLFNITRQKLRELGIIWTDHQDIILKEVSNINKKTKMEEQVMQPEHQHDKKMATRFKKQSEHLELATDRVRVIILERRTARTLHDTNEQQPHNIIAAAFDLINVVEMILNILQRPPLDCMSEFSSLKIHLIKHISLLNYFCEQSDLDNEMESDMIDVCKGVTKMCNYIMDLPPEVTGPEEMSPRVPVPVAIDPELMSFSVEHGPGYVIPTVNSSVPIAIRSSLSEHGFLLQEMSLQNETVSYRSECFSPEILNSPSEGVVMMPPDKGKKSKTEFSDTKDFRTLAGFGDYENLQEMPVIKYSFFLPDSESEKGMIDSDSDRGIDFDDDSEDQSKDSYSPIWGIDSDSETCPMDSDSVKHLLEGEYQIASGSVKDMLESEQHLVGAEQFQVDYDILKYWIESDSEIYLSDSDNERFDMDSDSEKCPIASASAKHMKADKCQMASDSIKCLVESQRLIGSKQHRMMVPASEKYVMDSDMEEDKMDSASASGVQLIGKGKHQANTRLERYTMDSDSEPCGKDSNSERHTLATVAAECLLGAKTCQLSTDTEGYWMDSSSERHTKELDSKNLGMVSDSAKHMKKAKSCQSEFAFETFQVDLRPESEKSSTDSERQHFDLDYDTSWDSSTSYEYMPARFPSSSEICQVDLQTDQDNFERHQLDSDSKKHGTNSENEEYQNEFESERHMMKMEREQCLIQLESERLQMDKEQKKYDIHPESKKEHWIASGNEGHHCDTENEAERLGARKKANRPPGFWRPLYLLPSSGQAKKTEEKYSVQQTGNKGFSGIQHEGHLSDEKIVRCKEVSPTVSDKQASQQKLKKKHSHNISPDPNMLVANKDQINPSHRISSCDSHCKKYRQLQSFQSSRSQINLLNAEDNKSEVSATHCHPTSMSPKTRSDTMDTGATICSKCFMEINISSFHKCLRNSNNDSDSDCFLHLPSSFCSKYCLSPRPIRQGKASQKSPLSQALDMERMVGIRCPKHRRDSKYSSGSTYLHHENCLAFQNLIHSTITNTFPMNPENTTSHHSTSEPGNIINVSNIIGLESEVQFNLTTQLENEANSDNETELVSGDHLKNEATAKDKPLLKDERNCEDESDSEDETESEDEEDAENKNNTEDKKDPKDKSDHDDNDPKGSNSEKDADANNGSDSSGNADDTSGADSNGDGNSNNGTDGNGRPDSNINKGTNNDANPKHSTDSEEENDTNSLDNASILDNGQHCTADFSNSTNQNHTCEVQNRTGMDCTSNSNYDAGLSSATRSGNGIYLYNGTGTTKEAGPNNNRPGPNLNESLVQNNGPGPQNNRQCPNLPGFNNNGSGLNTNLILINSPGLNDNISILENYPDFNNNARPYHASHNSPFISNKDIDSNYDTKSTSEFYHNYSAVQNYYSVPDYVSRFIHIVGSSFVVNPNNITKSRYAVRPSSTNGNGNGNVSDGSNSTSCGGAISPSYIAFTSYASDTIHETRFFHVNGSIFVTTPSCDAINTTNVHNSTSTTNINFSKLNLGIGSNFSVPYIVYDSTPTFAAGTNYTFTPENLSTSTSFDLYKFGGNHTSTDYHKFDVYPKTNDGSMDSIFMHATKSKYVLDAKESGLSKYFSSVQNPIGIKDPSSLNFQYDSKIVLLSFDIIVEAEQPDVVKFAISSGAVNQFVKSLDNLRAEGGSLRGLMLGTTKISSEGCAWEPAEGLSQEYLRKTARELKGGLPVISLEEQIMGLARGCSVSRARGFALRPEVQPTVSPTWRHAFSAARGYAVSPGKEYFERYTRVHAISPTKRLVVSPANGHFMASARGHAMTHARGYAESPTMGPTENPVRTYLLSPTRGHSMIPAREHAESPIGGLAVNPGRGYVVGPGRRHIRRPASAHPEISTTYTVGIPRVYSERQTKLHVLSPTTSYMVNATHGLALGQARKTIVSPAVQSTMRSAEELILGSAVELTVKPAEGCTGKTSKKPAKLSNRSTTDGNQNRLKFPISKDTRDHGFIYLPEFSNILAAHHRKKQIVSVIPSFQKRRAKDVPEKFIYFRPISSEFQEMARIQNQEELAMLSYQRIREEHNYTRTPKNLWLESSVNAEFPRNDGLEVARSRYPFRERPITRYSWEELLDASLNREGLHILKSVTEEKREIGNLPLLPEENRATASRSSQHLYTFQGGFPFLPQHLKLQRQHSHSLSQYSDIRSQKLNTQERNNIEESSRKTILSASREHLPINPSFKNYSVMRGKLGIPGDNGRHPRGNVRIPMNNVGVPMGHVESLRNSVGTSTHTASSALAELLKIGEHQV